MQVFLRLGASKTTAPLRQRQFLEATGLCDDDAIAEIDGRFMSAFVRAKKPLAAAKTCCGPTCCA